MGHREQVNRARGETIAWCLLSLVLVFCAVVAAALLVRWLGIPSKSLWRSIIPEVVAAAAVLACVARLAGWRFLTTSRDDAVTVFRLGWWDILVTMGFAAFLFFLWCLSEEELPVDWLVRLAETTLFCLCVGLFEEALFRGIIFQGLLAWMGGTHEGVVRAVVATSIGFGLMHIDYRIATIDLLTLTQALLKVVQTGMYSFLLCVIVLRSRRLGGASLLHAFDDLLVLAPGIVLYGGTFSVEYVSTGDDAPNAIALYITVIVLSLPFVVMAALELKRGRYVTYGAFVERMVPDAMAYAPPPALPAPPPEIPPIVEGPVSAPVMSRGATTPAVPAPSIREPPPPDGFR